MVPRHQSLIHKATPLGSSSRSSSRSSISARRPMPPSSSSPWWWSPAVTTRGGGLAALSPCNRKESHPRRIVTSSSSSSSSSCLAAAPSNENATDGRSPSLSPKSSRPFQHTMMHALGPTTLIGGTAIFYSAVYRHPACTLSPLSAFYLLLLALQTSIQPRLSRKHIKPSTNKQAVALVEEVVKTILAAGLFFGFQEQSIIENSLSDWSIASSLAVAGIPSILYAAQGVLTYTSHQHLNAVTFNGLSQTKTVSAALWCYLLLGTKQSRIQMLAIGILFVSALIFQGLLIVVRPTVVPSVQQQQQSQQQQTSSSSSPSPAKDTTKDSSTTSSPPPTSSSVTSSRNSSSKDSTWFAKGIVPCLGATFISGLAGAFSQRGLQLVGGNGRNAFLFTIEVSFFSALTLVVSMIWNHCRNVNNNNRDYTKTTRRKFMSSSFSWSNIWSHRSDILQTLIPITVKALGGILTALVHKHAGSVLKGFALVLGLVLSGLLQTVMDEENLSVNQGIGTLLVMLSSWMHFTNPPTM